jgi:hypothetical protein
MLRLAADENFNNDILRGLLRRVSDMDVVRMPGVFEVSRDVPIGRAIEDILLLVECSLDGEWEGQVRYLPL